MHMFCFMTFSVILHTQIIDIFNNLCARIYIYIKGCFILISPDILETKRDTKKCFIQKLYGSEGISLSFRNIRLGKLK